MPTPEHAVLKPIDPSITDSDDYEIFVLSDVQVVYESNGRLASLLVAYADTPLRVEGRLEAPGRGQAKCLVKRPYRPVDLEIRNVTRFSYGQMTDGEFVIWALGEAGWFEIRPAPHYQALFNDMVEAVELLYFIMDIHDGPRKRGGGPNAQLIFQEYAENERFACTDAALAAQIFRKHIKFLLMCFLNRAQGISWSNTPIYQYFRRQYPKEFENAKARIEGRFVLTEPPALREARSSKASPDPALPTTSAPSKSRAARGKQTQPSKSTDAPKKNNNWWEAAALFEFMQKAVNQRVLRPGHGHITLDRVARLVVRRYEIEEMEMARNVLYVHAQNLCYMMDHPRRKSIKFFAEEPIYAELANGHNLPATEIRRAEGVELKPRKDHSSLKNEASESSDEDEQEDEADMKTPLRKAHGRKKRGRLSILRPKSSKYSGKSKGKGLRSGKGKGPKLVDSSDNDSNADEVSREESDSESEKDSEDELGIDTPTQALSSGREKRKFISTDADGAEEKGRRKRAASKSASITPDSPPSSGSDSEQTDIEGGAEDDIPLPLRHRSTLRMSDQTQLVPPLVSSPLPTYEANGPRDSWNCTFDGCSKRIYGASKEIGRQLITEHLEDHAKGRHLFTNILLREEERLRLPVDNLLKKIREMSESATPLFPSPSPKPGTTTAAFQPQPIRRNV